MKKWFVRTLYKNWYTSAHHSFIYMSPKVLPTQVSINTWMDKKIVVYPHSGYCSVIKKECIINTHNDMDESQHNYTEWKKARQKENIYWTIPFIYNPGKCELVYSDRRLIRGCLVIGRGWGQRQQAGITKGPASNFWGDEYVHYLDCGNGFMGVCLRQSWSNSIL